MDAYSKETNEKIDTVSDILLDEQGRFIYLVVDLGVWILCKKVLLPVGYSRLDYQANRIYAIALTRAQADALPEYQERRALDYDYEEQVRGLYRTQQAAHDATEKAASNETVIIAVYLRFSVVKNSFLYFCNKSNVPSHSPTPRSLVHNSDSSVAIAVCDRGLFICP